MGEPIVILALRRKRDRIESAIAGYERLRRGEITGLSMAALRTEGPLDTHELTSRVMTAKGLNRDDWVIAQAISLRIVQTLRMKARRGGILNGSERRNGAVCGG